MTFLEEALAAGRLPRANRRPQTQVRAPGRLIGCRPPSVGAEGEPWSTAWGYPAIYGSVLILGAAGLIYITAVK